MSPQKEHPDFDESETAAGHPTDAYRNTWPYIDRRVNPPRRAWKQERRAMFLQPPAS